MVPRSNRMGLWLPVFLLFVGSATAVQAQPLTSEALAGRWEIAAVNGAAPNEGPSMVLELAADGTSFMEMGTERIPAGGWSLVNVGTVQYLRQLSPDGTSHDNLLTAAGAERFQLDDGHGNILIFQRVTASVGATFSGTADATLAGNYVAGPSPTGGTDLVADSRLSLAPDGTLTIARSDGSYFGRWGTLQNEGGVWLLQLEVNDVVFEAGFVLDPQQNLVLITADSQIYPLGRQ